jgi:hypothetical protein
VNKEGQLPFASEYLALTSSVKQRYFISTRNLVGSFVGCVFETWSVLLKEEYRLRVLEYKVLRKIFGRRRQVVKRRSRKLGNEDIPSFRSYHDYIKKSFVVFILHQTFL